MTGAASMEQVMNGPALWGGWRMWHTHLELIDTAAGHNKFYAVTLGVVDGDNDVQDCRVLRRWGRIGTTGTVRLDPQASLNNGVWHARHQLNAKIGKGYNATNDGPLTDPSNDMWTWMGVNPYVVAGHRNSSNHLTHEGMNAELERVPTYIADTKSWATADRVEGLANMRSKMTTGIQTLTEQHEFLVHRAKLTEQVINKAIRSTLEGVDSKT